MRKITLLLASFALAGGAFAQETKFEAQLIDHLVDKEALAADDCAQETQSIRYVLSGQDWEYADDLVVPANTTFELEELYSEWRIDPGHLPDEDLIEVNIYKDNDGEPGELIEVAEPFIIVSLIDPEVLEGTDLISLTVFWEDETVTLEAGEEDTSFWVGIHFPWEGKPGGATTAQVENGHEFVAYVEVEGTEMWAPGSILFESGESLDLIFDFYGQCETLDVEDFEMASFSHYVQNGQLFLQSDSTIENAVLYNLLGQQVVSSALNATSGSIDLSGLSSGVYLAKLNIDGQVKTLKFFVK